jgi:TolB-like protein/Tfp pilus assembly protein PilF/predicted Ser/Thr protein kinase
MPTAPGTRVGPYEILDPLGAGGMGEVYKATDTRLGRTVAIKFLRATHSERFEREARAIAAVNHPHICTLYDIGLDYLVMEYVEGSPLRGPLQPEEALRLAVQIAEALEAAHRKGIIHRDLKPGNVLVNEAGVKLLDFGLAKLQQESHPAADTLTQTQAGTILGTAAYMSPEQAEGRPADARSDVFSFGVVLYEMLSGRQAFSGQTSVSTMAAILHKEPEPLGGPAEVESIIRRCLRKAPAERYQTIGEVRAMLESVKLSPAQHTPSIAVLPFANMSGDKENEYFSDGLAEEIINALTKMRGLRVTARTSAFSFRGRDLEIREIAGKLNVKYILEGSVRKSANRIRVTAQLIQAADGFHIWSERYDRELTEIFAIQDEISVAIAQQLNLTLLVGAKPERRVPKLAAYQAFLESRYHWQKLNPEGFEKSCKCVERALAIDPEYADAYVGLAAYYFSVAWYGGADPREVMPKGEAAARKALALDPNSPDVHSIMGAMKAVYEYDWAGAGEHFRKALAMDRGLYVALGYAIWYLRPLGRLEEALSELELLRQSDPLSPAARSEMAMVLLLMRRFEEAAQCARQALDLEPEYVLAWFSLITASVEQKRYKEAVSMAERVVQFSGRWQVPLTYLGYAYAAAGEMSKARSVCDEMHEVASRTYPTATAFANIYTALGEIDTAVDWLDKAIDHREPIVTLLKTWSLFDRVRSHPRYPALLRKMNLDRL